MKKLENKIDVRVEKTNSGYSAFVESMQVYATASLNNSYPFLL